MNKRSLNKALRILWELVIQVAIVFVVSVFMMTAVTGLPLSQTAVGGAVAAAIIVPGYQWIMRRPLPPKH